MYGENCIILTPTVQLIDPPCDGQTDRQRGGR